MLVLMIVLNLALRRFLARLSADVRFLVPLPLGGLLWGSYAAAYCAAGAPGVCFRLLPCGFDQIGGEPQILKKKKIGSGLCTCQYLLGTFKFASGSTVDAAGWRESKLAATVVLEAYMTSSLHDQRFQAKYAVCTPCRVITFSFEQPLQLGRRNPSPCNRGCSLVVQRQGRPVRCPRALR